MLAETAGRDRLAREREFWNHLYGERGRSHEETFAERYVSSLAYSRQVLHSTLDGLRKQKILSVGGGIDRLAIYLAELGNTAVSVDISPVAAALTRDMARERGVAERLAVVVGNCEEICFRSTFDVILCKRSLHHMDLRLVVPALWNLLREGGLFLAEEPICFLNLVRWFHDKAPFHPDPVRTVDEKELTSRDVAFVRAYFRECRTQFFDMATRESIVFFLSKFNLERSLTLLGRLDYLLTNRCVKALRNLSSYVIIEAYK
jgi:SAM-dependent methyltransferase